MQGRLQSDQNINLLDSLWELKKIGSYARISIRPIDKSVMEKMPSSTKTFLERNLFDVIFEKFNKIIY